MLGRLKAGGEGATEHEMVGWHHPLNGDEVEQTPGEDGGGGSRAGGRGLSQGLGQRLRNAAD